MRHATTRLECRVRSILFGRAQVNVYLRRNAVEHSISSILAVLRLFPGCFTDCFTYENHGAFKRGKTHRRQRYFYRRLGMYSKSALVISYRILLIALISSQPSFTQSLA